MGSTNYTSKIYVDIERERSKKLKSAMIYKNYCSNLIKVMMYEILRSPRNQQRVQIGQ